MFKKRFYDVDKRRGNDAQDGAKVLPEPVASREDIEGGLGNEVEVLRTFSQVNRSFGYVGVGVSGVLISALLQGTILETLSPVGDLAFLTALFSMLLVATLPTLKGLLDLDDAGEFLSEISLVRFGFKGAVKDIKTALEFRRKYALNFNGRLWMNTIAIGAFQVALIAMSVVTLDYAFEPALEAFQAIFSS